MTELDQIWSQMLDKAAAKARNSGNGEVTAYLTLKAANDTIRTVGVDWLMNSVIEIAGESNRRFSSLAIEREEPYRFASGSSNLVGVVIRIRHGVRCLNVEAGWTRTPSDGVMRGGALAFARLSHFGMPKAGAELMLISDASRSFWRVAETSANVDSNELRRHFEILTT